MDPSLGHDDWRVLWKCVLKQHTTRPQNEWNVFKRFIIAIGCQSIERHFQMAFTANHLCFILRSHYHCVRCTTTIWITYKPRTPCMHCKNVNRTISFVSFCFFRSFLRSVRSVCSFVACSWRFFSISSSLAWFSYSYSLRIKFQKIFLVCLGPLCYFALFIHIHYTHIFI